MTPSELRRTSPAGSWWTVDRGSALGQGRVPPVHTDKESGSSRPSTDHGRKVAEWTSFTISAVIILGLLALVIAVSSSAEESQAAISVTPQTDSSWQVDNQHYLPLEVANHGSQSAHDLRIRMRQEAGEISEIRIDILPGGASETAVISFPSAPNSGQISIQSISYMKP
ncbi:MAG: hypothetical protein ACKVVP_18075 [Chloroflexota bacterium]